MLSRLFLASLIAATPFSALAQSKGSPSFGTVTASQFVGPLSGNATSATTAQSAITANTATSATTAQSAATATTAASATIAGTAGTAGSLATPRTITVSGDAGCSFLFDGSANAGCGLTLAPSGVTPGTFGSASAIPVVTVDAKGRITGIATAPIAAAVTSVAGRTGAVTLAVADVSGAAPSASPTFTGVPAAPTASAGTNTTQLATTAFVGSAVAAVSSAAAPASRQILASGLATGGGDLTADRTITVPKAAQADVATGTDDAKALTSLSVASALAAKAPLASPTFTGTPAAPTAAANTNTTQIATTAFVGQAVSAVSGGGTPTTRQILTSGLATGGGDLTADRTITVPKAAQADVATGTDDAKALTSLSVASALGAKAPLASPAFTGTPTVPTAAANTNTTQAASTAFVTGALGSYLTTSSAAATYAPLASPTFTGTPAAPTPAANDNTTKLATTAYADRAASSAAAPAMPSGAVSYFAMSSCPATWGKANGVALSRTTYSGLFSAIGTTFGSGDGSTTFNPPDMRGYFPRSFDDGRGIDSGRAFGSAQADQNVAHTHTAGGATQFIVNGGSGGSANIGGGTFLNFSTMDSGGGGSEARPKNIALLACIKY